MNTRETFSNEMKKCSKYLWCGIYFQSHQKYLRYFSYNLQPLQNITCNILYLHGIWCIQVYAIVSVRVYCYCYFLKMYTKTTCASSNCTTHNENLFVKSFDWRETENLHLYIQETQKSQFNPVY